jgi:hypothetical protein
MKCISGEASSLFLRKLDKKSECARNSGGGGHIYKHLVTDGELKLQIYISL